MSKSKVMFYEVHLYELFPESISVNYRLVSTSQKGTPWLTAFLIPNGETIDKEIVYYVTTKHFRSIKTMYKWFIKNGITHGKFSKFVKTPTKRKIINYTFNLRR